MRKHLLKTLVPTFIAITVSLPAMAEIITHQSVKYADLDLSNKAGVETLYKRVKAAARRVCGPNAALRKTGSIRQVTTDRACYQQAMANAIVQIDHPQLSTLHAGYQNEAKIALNSDFSK